MSRGTYLKQHKRLVQRAVRRWHYSLHGSSVRHAVLHILEFLAVSLILSTLSDSDVLCSVRLHLRSIHVIGD